MLAYFKIECYLYIIEINKQLKKTETMTTLEQATILGTITILLNRCIENGMTPKEALLFILEGSKNNETDELMLNVKKHLESI